MMLALLLLSILTLNNVKEAESPLEVPPQRKITIGTKGEPETVDPHWLYDTASAELVMHVYDTLISFKVDRTRENPKDWGRIDEFMPNIATEWYLDETDPNHPVMYFKIRTGVQFQNGHVLNTADVEYSFERWLVLDHTGGPQWMIYEPLLYPRYSWDFSDPNFYQKVDVAIESNNTHVWFTFARPYPAIIFLQVIAQPWASILPMDWAIDQGCWDGNWAHVAAYHDPEVSPLMDPEPVMCGTGPFKFVEWTAGSHWKVDRFLNHWEGWPAPGCDSEVDVVEEKFINDWSTRKSMFLAGDLDFCLVPRANISEVLGQPGIRCHENLLKLGSDANFYNFNISLTSRYLYPPFITHLDYGVIAETGIPPDFFSDVNLRKAFSYSVNYAEFLQVAYLGEATYPATPAIFGLPYRRPQSWYDANQYYYDPIKATYYFKLAWGGDDPTPGDWDVPAGHEGLVWKNGFKLPLCYNTGNLPRKTMVEDQIKTHVEAINPLFHIDVYDVEWGTVYVPELFSWKLTLFIIGWIPDYPDPHNFFFPFMHTYGSFSYFQSYSDPHVDDLIEEGATTNNETRRQEIYYELQELYIDECPSVCIYQPYGRQWERTCMRGWYYNPIYPGVFCKHYWKESVHDVAIVDVQPSETFVDHGSSTFINVTVENQGDFTETFNVAAYADTIMINQTEVTLTSGISTNLTFTWDTTGFATGNYIISAVAEVVANETATSDNTCVDGVVAVRLPGPPPERIYGIPVDFRFNNDLHKGNNHPEVRYLQIILNSDPDTRVATSGEGSPGNETTYFGDLTENAVKKFQKKYGLPETGYVGELTRGKLNEILNNKFTEEYKNSFNLLNTTERKSAIWNDIKSFKSSYPDLSSFPNELILAVAAVETGEYAQWNNEHVANDWGRGIMQITSNEYVGAGGVDNESEDCIKCRDRVLRIYCSKYYSNTLKGIEANIKDGLYALREKYQSVNKSNIEAPEGYTTDEIIWISTIQRYNAKSPHPTDYIGNISDKLSRLANGEYGQFDDFNKTLAQLLGEKFRRAYSESIRLYSPGELRVYDITGNVTGLVNGEIREEISNSIYDNETETVIVFFPSQNYYYDVAGTETWTYGLYACLAKDNATTTFTAIDIPTSPNATHQYAVDWAALSLGEEGVTVEVDSDGDGIFEYNFTSDGELTRTEYVIATTKYDIGITGITPSKSIIGQGYNLPMNITIMNYGAYSETFNVTLYVNETLVELQTVTLASGNFTTVTFTWNTTGFAKGKYTISAATDTLLGEAYTEDNTLRDSWVIVTIPGDVNGDRLVDVSDLVLTVNAIPSALGWPNWDSNADINGDGVCDISDLVICVGNIPSGPW